MKKYTALVFFLLLFYSGFTQETPTEPKGVNEGKDILVLDFFTDLWQDAPSTAKVRPINQGISLYVMLNYPLGTSNFSLTSGLGISYHNFFSDAIPSIRDSSGMITGKTEYYKLNDYYKKTVDYSINKTAVTYLEIPLELKFKTRAERNKRFKASIGFKLGYNISNHTKYSGEDVIENTKDEITIKKSNIKYINNWTYGLIARLGYGKFNIMAYYSLSKLYEKNLGPQMYPISLGISITPF